ncbi:MAG TPA: hypothetical protein ENH82_13485 [bacterium]|nr:hypothetical protein [bacterium]
MKKVSFIAVMLLALLVSQVVIWGEEYVTYNADIEPIISSNCSNCHNWSGTWEGSYENIIEAKSIYTVADIPIVYPSKPDSSVIIWRIEGKLPSGDLITRMPKFSGSLPEETIELFRTWIEQGAFEDTPVAVEDKTNTWLEIKKKFK